MEFIITQQQTPPNRCLKCGKLIDCATSLPLKPGEKQGLVKEGCISICSFCGALAMYSPARTLLPIPPEEMERIRQDKKVWGAITLLLSLLAKKNGFN